jgi:hypothetical protein
MNEKKKLKENGYSVSSAEEFLDDKSTKMNPSDFAETIVLGKDIPDLFFRIAKTLKRFESIPEIKGITLEKFDDTSGNYLLKIEFAGEHNAETCVQCKDELEHPENYT